MDWGLILSILVQAVTDYVFIILGQILNALVGDIFVF